MQMQTAVVIAVLAGLITSALMVAVGQFLAPEPTREDSGAAPPEDTAGGMLG